MKRITRSRRDRKIAGVCGGLGELMNVDPTLIRLALVFLDVATGIIPMAAAYLVAWLIVPEEPVIAPAQPSGEQSEGPAASA